MKQFHLGEFEEIVLLAVAILNGNAYGISIVEEIEERISRSVSLGAMQTVLKRLEGKGLLVSEFGEATSVRGGKRKRFYTVTAEGKKILQQTRSEREALWNAIPNTAIHFA